MRSLVSLVLVAVSAFAGFSTPATAYPPYDITVVNRSSQDIKSFYATRSSRSGWGRDLFGDETLSPGYNWKRSLADGTGACIFDLKAVMDDGSVVTRYELNVCNTSRWTIYD